MNDIRVYFFIARFGCELTELSKLMGCAPTEAWLKGDKWLGSIKRKESLWRLAPSISSKDTSIEKLLGALVNTLESRHPVIRKLSKKYSTGISCVSYYHDGHPGFHLPHKLITRLQRLGLSVDFDLYCLGKASRPKPVSRERKR